MNLSPHFSLEELTCSETAARLGLDNYPATLAYENLKMLAASLEQVRALLGHPIHVNSGYRSPEVNARVGGARMSAHMDGLAADIVCPQFGTPIEVCQAIWDSAIPFDQTILEFYNPSAGSGWCHFAIAHKGLIGRREALTIKSAATGYEKGLRM